MKKNILFIIAIISLMAIIIAGISLVGLTKYEWYDANDDDQTYIHNDETPMQSFTVGNTGTDENFEVKGAAIKGYYQNSGDDYLVWANIFSTNATGFPTGLPLATSEAVDIGDFGSGSPGTWQNFTFASPATLQAATQYALVLNTTAPDDTDFLTSSVSFVSEAYSFSTTTAFLSAGLPKKFSI